jgi:Txe/YoeB family toxin of Txe-Axe toxin-antitoxin module
VAKQDKFNQDCQQWANTMNQQEAKATADYEKVKRDQAKARGEYEKVKQDLQKVNRLQDQLRIDQANASVVSQQE